MTLIKAKDHFLKILSNAQSQRTKKSDIVYDHILDYGVPEWQIFERQIMLTEINRWRIARELDPICEQKLYQVEQFAVGHIDYSSKFALYCAKLALFDNPY